MAASSLGSHRRAWAQSVHQRRPYLARSLGFPLGLGGGPASGLQTRPRLTIHSLPEWHQVRGPEIAIAAENVGMVRVQGLDCPLDIFREPNEFPPGSFGEVYERATRNTDGTRLPDSLDLIITKPNTDRSKDLEDSRILESVIRERYRVVLPTAPLDEVRRLLDRFLDWEVCAMALSNPSPGVKDHATHCLRRFDCRFLTAISGSLRRRYIRSRPFPWSRPIRSRAVLPCPLVRAPGLMC